jgi:eukaryotic-like serine/threonine-protein kinase
VGPDSTLKLPLPEQIIGGRYRLLSRLGSGGMGLVFLAEQLGVGNQVALKFLDPEPSGDDTRVARFLREAKVGLAVHHPGAAQLLDVGRDEQNRLYIAFEYVEGQDLRELLRAEGRLTFAEARDIALKVAEVLAFAHQRDIVHRDIKPENIRVRRDLAGVHVKVLDFGIARLLKGGGVRLTAEGSLAGTPRYMAPEQVRDEPIDGRADGYALGLVLYEMLTGGPPFAGRSLSHTLMLQIEEPLPPLQQLADDLHAPVLDAFLARACAKRPDARFPSMAEFIQALRALPVDEASWPAPRRHVPSPEARTQPMRAPRTAGLSDTLVRREGPTQPTAASMPRSEVASTLMGAPLPPAPALPAAPASRRRARTLGLVLAALVVLAGALLALLRPWG